MTYVFVRFIIHNLQAFKNWLVNIVKKRAYNYNIYSETWESRTIWIVLVAAAVRRRTTIYYYVILNTTRHLLTSLFGFGQFLRQHLASQRRWLLSLQHSQPLRRVFLHQALLIVGQRDTKRYGCSDEQTYTHARHIINTV